MNYSRHYGLLIERAQNRKINPEYTERHHIVPRCLGGPDAPSNLVRLSAEEHYLAHQLLVKIHPLEHKLVYAACLMAHGPTPGRLTNKTYSWLKKKLASVQSVKFSGKIWTDEQNASRSDTVKKQWADPDARALKVSGMLGKTWSVERRAAKSASLKGKPGRVWTAEQKAKLSASKRNAFLQRTAERSRKHDECAERGIS